MSRKKAIDAFCKACIYDRGTPGTWRQQVEACTAPKCPLFAYRPKSATGRGR
jgi:hypothetical protein